MVLSLGADVLCEGSAGVRYARDFAEGRRVRAHHDTMTRVYTVESSPVGLSALADHRLQLPPAQVEGFVLALAQALGVAAGRGAPPLADPKAQKWVAEVAKDLQANRGASLVVGDEYLSPAAQVLVHGINEALGQRRLDRLLSGAGRGRSGRPRAVAAPSWCATWTPARSRRC